MFIKGKTYKCYKCGEELVFEVKIGRMDTCPNCQVPLHCCFNCEYWNPNVHNQCTINKAEFIRDRAEPNFCLYFTFKDPDRENPEEQKAAKQKLEELFGKTGKTSPQSADEAKKRLEELFSKKKK